MKQRIVRLARCCSLTHACCKARRTAVETAEPHMLGSLKSRSPRDRETARPVLVPRAVVMMRQQRCISTRPPLRSTRARSRSSPGLWSARQTTLGCWTACFHDRIASEQPRAHPCCISPGCRHGRLWGDALSGAGARLLSGGLPSSPVIILLCNLQHAQSTDTCLRCTVLLVP